ncbi:MAG: glycoside hydrolase family 38 C-terminal domain-containing protein [Vampirovibrionales bacterium]|nr:glycoside hydrolase family 38 C-terminal domain-containing protein [Vampirovibrionales bacterium]
MALKKNEKHSVQKQPVVYLQTHWDREWYQSFRAYQVRLAEVTDAILDSLEAGVFPCFMLDGQTVLLDDYLALRPKRKAQLEKLIKSGKLKIGPWYVMPDEFLVGGESLIRNLAYGIVASRTYGQSDHFCGYLPDTFGHSADMPTILSQFGIDTAILWRGVSPNNSEFWWQSPSGEKVLGYFLADGYLQMMLHMADDDPDLGTAGKQGLLKALSDKLSKRTDLSKYLLPIGGDHLGPLDKAAIELMKKTLPDLAIETPDTFLAAIRPDFEQLGNKAEMISGELVNNDEAFLLPGVYSGRLYLKQQNRMLEHALVYHWEPLQVLIKLMVNSAYGLPELALAWQTLLLNHPHDSICGCSVDEVHLHNEVRFSEVEALYAAVMPRLKKLWLNVLGVQKAEAAHQLVVVHSSSSSSHPSSSHKWLVLNTLGQNFSGVVQVQYDGDARDLMQLEKTEEVLNDAYLSDFKQVPLAHKTKARHWGWMWIEDIPALGYRLISTEKDAEKNTPSLAKSRYARCSSKNCIENEFYQLSVETDGSLSVLQKGKDGVTISNLHCLRDSLQQGDSYNAAPVPGAKPEFAKLLKISSWQNGPLVAGIIAHYELCGMAIESRIWLEAGSPLLLFETRFTNTNSDHLLQVGFETPAPIFQVKAEGHFSTLTRAYDPAYDLMAQMPAAHWKELKTNTGPIQRYLSANGQVFFTQGLSEYEVSGSTLLLTLLRSFGKLSKADTGVRGAQAGPPLPTPQGQCIGRTITARYAWALEQTITAANKAESGDAHLCNFAQRYYGSVEAIAVSGAPEKAEAQMIGWDNGQVAYTACTLNASGQVILRLLNRSCKSETLHLSSSLGLSQYQEASALGEALPRSAETSFSKPLCFSPNELKTLLLS